MRLMFASLTVLAAVAIAAPSHAQQEVPATPTPIAKPKPGTAAYCNTLKSASSRSACLKRVHAQAPAKAPAKTKAKTLKKGDPAPAKPGDSAELFSTSATAAAPKIVIVPPLPQKTI